MEKNCFNKDVRSLVAVVGLSVLSACGGGESGGRDGAGGPGPGTLTGTFSDSAVSGMTYLSTPSGYSGTTGSSGEFTYLPFDTVTFRVNGMSIGSGTGAATMTPMDLVADPLAMDTTKPVGQRNEVLKLLRLLQTLDTDKTPSNGITIKNNGSLASKSLDTLDLTSTADLTAMGVTSADVVSEDAAAAHFLGQLDAKGQTSTAFRFVTLMKKAGTTGASTELTTRWASRKSAVEAAIQAKLDGLTKTNSNTKHGTLPGVVVKLTLPDGTPQTYVSGYSDMGADTKIIDGDETAMTADKHFRIGSITKTFTGLTVLQLVQEGKIDLNPTASAAGATLGTYLSDAKIDPNNLLTAAQLAAVKKITVYQLLTHLSGIPQTSAQKITNQSGGLDYNAWALVAYLDSNFTGKSYAITGLTYSAWTPQNLIDISWGIGVEAPGKNWHYSNINYVFLGEIIKSVTGNQWYTEVANRFGPNSKWGMNVAFDSRTTSTTLPGGNSKGAKGYIDWYDGFDGACTSTPECAKSTKYEVTIHPSFYGASGGLTGGVNDLYTWTGAIGKTYDGDTETNGALLSPAMGYGSSAYYFSLIAGQLAMGPGVLKNVARHLVGHPGQVQGYDCAVWYRYDVQQPIAGCSNTTIEAGGKIQEKALFGIMDLLDGVTEVH